MIYVNYDENAGTNVTSNTNYDQNDTVTCTQATCPTSMYFEDFYYVESETKSLSQFSEDVKQLIKILKKDRQDFNSREIIRNGVKTTRKISFTKEIQYNPKISHKKALRCNRKGIGLRLNTALKGER